MPKSLVTVLRTSHESAIAVYTVESEGDMPLIIIECFDEAETRFWN